jgi:hypothetical protein
MMKLILPAAAALCLAAASPAFADGNGAVTGAAGGAVTGAVVGGPVGAAVGGAAGAVVGGAMSGPDKTDTVVVQPDPGCRTTTVQRQDAVGNTDTVQKSNCP